MLKIDDIHVYYGAIHAIKGVSFEVHEGEIVALIGANGAGKSTILKTVSGLMHPRSGSIQFMGQDITHMDAYKLLRHGLAHVPEGRRIFLQMSVQENLDMGAYTQKSVSKEDLDMVFDLFPRLKERRHQIAGTLSGGEQQMLAMSR
ncbi:MAG: ATP-binding cassette domain-containing protein, partial [Oscillospiraceae bacterium]|nr:ATP-binding cassette domain-containing protein [Oscillospiraceae bacterium]